ncbi:MAG TPA: ParB/RepB/Spo0J family partition protein [Dehalococcoidia bacterium]|nr:ParB/RepB/Spo0J family partition protein [Dehalococcoidia bacterium]
MEQASAGGRPQRRGLGRGLGALIPELTPAVEEVDIDLIVPNPQQPRSAFDPESLEELAQSIREHGVIQPLVVSKRDGQPGVYQLIAGERRLLASRRAGLSRVPVIVKEASPRALLELALVENLQREDLGPLEEAFAFKRLVDEFGLTQEAVAQRVGRSRSAVTNAIRLLSLPDEIQGSLARGEISAGHARALLAIDEPAERRHVWQRILQAALTVRDAERLAKQKRPARRRDRRLATDLAAVEDKLRSALGTKVEVVKGRRGGRLTIHFYSDEEMEAILERLLGA